MDREAIEEAIEVLEDASAEMLTETGNENYYGEAITALRKALVDADDTSQKHVDEMVKIEHDKQIEIAQAYERGWNAALAQQEPVAWMYVNEDGECEQIEYGPVLDDPEVTPLYTAPPKKQWVGLTDEDMEALFLNEDGVRFARYIEAKLKERNT